jgi:hypothetical protein
MPQQTKRRRKVTSAVHFPGSLSYSAANGFTSTGSQGAEPGAGEGEEGFELAGVVLHLGTALGGHYRAQVRRPASYPSSSAAGVGAADAAAHPQWIDCNDGHVAALTRADQAALFADSDSTGNAAAGSAPVGGDFPQRNAYMLLYTRSAIASAAAGKEGRNLVDLIPAHLRAAIEEENASLALRGRLAAIRSTLVEVRAALHPSGTEHQQQQQQQSERVEVSVLLPAATTVQEALLQVHAAFQQQQQQQQQPLPPVSQCRLRLKHARLLPASNRGRRARDAAAAGVGAVAVSQSSFGETFGARPDLPLSEITRGGSNSSSSSSSLDGSDGPALQMVMETRGSQDPDFTEFNAADMNITISLYSPPPAQQGAAGTDADADTDAGKWLPLLVPGAATATVGALRQAVAGKLALDATRCFLLIQDNEDRPVQLLGRDQDQALLSSVAIYPGDDSIVVEVLPSDADADAVQSVALGEIEGRRKNVVVYFNDPRVEATAAVVVVPALEPSSDAGNNRDGAYSFTLDLSLDQQLSEVKKIMAEKLGISDPSAFHVRRSGAISAPQLKDESKTLRDLAVANHAVLHLQVRLLRQK